jgi:hypothetical protein
VRVTLTVVMQPAHGGARPAGGVTSKDAALHAPDADAARRVQAWFARQGFEVAPMVGTAFAITAGAEHARAVLEEVPGTGEVPLDRLPDELARHISAIVAEPPPDFGPTSW